MAQQILALDPDVLLLQEVETTSLRDILRCQEAAHRPMSVAASALVDKISSKDGVAVLVRKSRFDVIDRSTIRFADHVGTDLPGVVGAAPFLANLRHKENHAVVTTVVEKETQERLHVCSVRLYWDPVVPEIKLAQAFLFAKALQRYTDASTAATGTKAPVLVGADLNSTPSSAVYELLTGKEVPPTHAEHPCSVHGRVGLDGVPVLQLDQAEAFQSAYARVLGEEPEYTNFTATFRGTLDYILMKGLKAEGVAPLPKEDVLKRHVALPSVECPSDHLPLLAEFSWASWPVTWWGDLPDLGRRQRPVSHPQKTSWGSAAQTTTRAV